MPIDPMMSWKRCGDGDASVAPYAPLTVRGGPLVLTFLALFAACGSEDQPSAPGGDDTNPVRVPAIGGAATLDAATWNLEFFGAPDGGPADDRLQSQRAREVIEGTDLDLWGVQEISDPDEFRSLVAGLEGYSGFLANDPSVADGPGYYNDFSGTEQKVGVLYKADLIEILAARVVLTDLDYEFAGRPPLEIETRVTLGGGRYDLVVLVLHAKANTQIESWERRAGASEGLKRYLDAQWPDQAVLVLGDWNDDIDTSIVDGRDTPYRDFVDDPGRWTFLTRSLTEAGQTSIMGYDDLIDHVLASNETNAWYEAGSAMVYRLDSIVPRYRETTSDHFPVLVRLRPN